MRSCYCSTWRLFNNSDEETPGYYFFSSPGAPFYPGLHNLWSRQWVTEEYDDPALGETLERHSYRKGDLPCPAPPAVVVGDQARLANGDTLPLPVIDRTLPAGIDSRCYPIGQVPIVDRTFPPPVDCGACASGTTQAAYQVTFPGLTSGSCNCTPLQGVIIMPQQSPCAWASDPIPYCKGTRSIVVGLRWVQTFGPQVTVTDNNTNLLANYTGASSFNCAAPVTIPLDSTAFGFCQWPSTCLVQPVQPFQPCS